jgi:hypothetical protein
MTYIQCTAALICIDTPSKLTFASSSVGCCVTRLSASLIDTSRDDATSSKPDSTTARTQHHMQEQCFKEGVPHMVSLYKQTEQHESTASDAVKHAHDSLCGCMAHGSHMNPLVWQKHNRKENTTVAQPHCHRLKGSTPAVSSVANAGYLATRFSRAAGDRPDLAARSATLQRWQWRQQQQQWRQQ